MKASHIIATENTPETALLVLMLRLKFGTTDLPEIEKFIKSHNINFDSLLLLLKEHDLESILYNIQVYQLFDVKFPLDELRMRVEKRARFNLLLFAELIKLNSILQKDDFNVIFYKGVLLSKLLFDDFTTRTTSDIDVLIRATDFLAIRTLILQNGYEEVYNFPEKYTQYYLQISREFTFKKQVSENLYVFIEIQWAPLPSIYGIPYNNDNFFANLTLIKLSGLDIPILKSEQHLLILLLHHGVSDLWRNFKHIFDLAMFIKRYGIFLNWPEIFEQIEKWKISKSAYIGFYLCKDLLGADIPLDKPFHQYQSEIKMVEKSLLSYPLLPKQKKNYKNINRQLYLCQDGIERAKLIFGYIKIFIFPSPIDLENIVFPKILFPLYFVTKHIRFFFKK